MEYRTIYGRWWLPESPGHKVPGTLTLDAAGLRLSVHEQLRTLDSGVVVWGGGKWTVEPVVHGLGSGGQELTVFEAGAVTGPFEQNEQDYSVRWAALGRWLDEDDFTAVEFSFDHLTKWTEPPRMTLEDDVGVIKVDPSSYRVGDATIGADVLELRIGSSGTASESAIHLDRAAAFTLRMGAPATFGEILKSRIGPLHDLLTLTLGRPVRITYVKVERAQRSGREPMVDLIYDAQQVPPSTAPTPASLRSHPTIVLLPDLLAAGTFSEVFRNWYILRERQGQALVQLLVPHYVTFLFAQHRFTTAYQAAEAYSGEQFGSQELDDEDHHKRVQLVMDSLDAELDREEFKWAKRVLKSKLSGTNYKTQRQLIRELIAATGRMGRDVMLADPKFDRTVANNRGGLSHSGGSGELTGLQLHWYSETLRWLVRARLTADLGVPFAEVEKAARTGGWFKRAVREVREAAQPTENPERVEPPLYLNEVAPVWWGYVRPDALGGPVEPPR